MAHWNSTKPFSFISTRIFFFYYQQLLIWRQNTFSLLDEKIKQCTPTSKVATALFSEKCYRNFLYHTIQNWLRYNPPLPLTRHDASFSSLLAFNLQRGRHFCSQLYRILPCLLNSGHSGQVLYQLISQRGAIYTSELSLLKLVSMFQAL